MSFQLWKTLSTEFLEETIYFMTLHIQASSYNGRLSEKAQGKVFNLQCQPLPPFLHLPRNRRAECYIRLSLPFVTSSFSQPKLGVGSLLRIASIYFKVDEACIWPCHVCRSSGCLHCWWFSTLHLESSLAVTTGKTSYTGGLKRSLLRVSLWTWAVLRLFSKWAIRLCFLHIHKICRFMTHRC